MFTFSMPFAVDEVQHDGFKGSKHVKLKQNKCCIKSVQCAKTGVHLQKFTVPLQNNLQQNWRGTKLLLLLSHT